MSCCTSGLSDVFDEDFARREADRYRKRGLPPRARRLLDILESVLPLRGVNTLEAGIGSGALTVEMLRRGATHATAIDAVPAQIAAAKSLAAEYQLQPRVDFVVDDFAHTRQPAADVVVLDRVVCCYPDWRTMLESAVAHSTRVIAMSYPRDSIVMRAVHHVMDIWFIMIRSDFRFHVHSVAQMHAALEHAGFRMQRKSRYFWWELLVAERTA